MVKFNFLPCDVFPHLNATCSIYEFDATIIYPLSYGNKKTAIQKDIETEPSIPWQYMGKKRSLFFYPDKISAEIILMPVLWCSVWENKSSAFPPRRLFSDARARYDLS